MSNLGKKFESIVKEALQSENACFDRLPDQVSGLVGSANPADFTAYLKPNYFYIECKSTHQASFDIKNMITEYQWITLLEKSKYKGVYAGYLIWFVNEQAVYWVSAVNAERLYAMKKSFRTADLEGYSVQIPAAKRGMYIKLSNVLKTIAAKRKRK